MLALDGADPGLIQGWAAQGLLPNFRRLIGEGVSGGLESTIPPVTSPAWPSFMTGKNPGKHGVFDFISHRQGDFQIVNASLIDGPVLWQILSERGKRVGVMGVPVTYPPRPVNGFLISGGLAPSLSDFCYPSDLLEPYQAELGPYRISLEERWREGNEQAALDDIENLTRQRIEYTCRLAQDHDWDFFMVHFHCTDNVQHFFWKFFDPTHPQHDPERAPRFGGAILRIYQMMDEALARFLEIAGPGATFMVMSDHGQGPLHGVVNLNNFLQRRGYLRLKRDPTTRVKATFFRWGLTPSRAYQVLRKAGLQNLTRRVSKQTRNRILGEFLSFANVDWSRTTAYSLGHIGQVYLNVRGREPQGIVERGAEYDRVRERLANDLLDLRDPHSGRPLVEQVIRKEEVCFGPHFDEAPDLYPVMDGYRVIAYPLFASDSSLVTRQITGHSGSHRLHGTFIARGPLFEAGKSIAGARLIDLTPTVLYLLGLPVPDDMDGQVLVEALRQDFVQAHPVRHEVTQAVRLEPVGAVREAPLLSTEEAKEVEERLRGLGYLG